MKGSLFRKLNYGPGNQRSYQIICPEIIKMRWSASEKPRGTTFFVQINFCQNAGWQGSVQWLEAKKRVSFRSFLELTMLLRQAVEIVSLEPLSDDARSRLSAPSLTGEVGGEKSEQP